LTEDDRKVLPKDVGSDFSLPGRLEESNSDYLDSEPIKPKTKNHSILVFALVFVVIAAGFFSYYFINQSEIDSKIIQNRINDPERRLVNQYGVGQYGSDHAHAAIAIFVNDEQINFGLSQFQVSSRYIHFENHNPYQIHKHATNVPLEMLFSSIGMKVTSECITLNDNASDEIIMGKFCSGEEKSLMVFVNGEQFYSDISQYEIKHNDRILISFGEDGLISKQLSYLDSLRIYDVPKETPQFSGNEISV